MLSNCYCGNPVPYKECCQPVISGRQKAKTPEALMRSRYSAYCIGDFPYIFRSYAQTRRQQLTVAELAEDGAKSRWLGLKIHSENHLSEHQVEFTAWYIYEGQIYQLHETSDFVLEQDEWKYDAGELHSDCGKSTIGRNDKCVCRSGKKYKHCCLPMAR